MQIINKVFTFLFTNPIGWLILLSIFVLFVTSADFGKGYCAGAFMAFCLLSASSMSPTRKGR